MLGRVVEVASGQSLGQFLKARLFDPLGMKDTSFYVTEPARQAAPCRALRRRRHHATAALFDPRVPQAWSLAAAG